MVRTVRDDVRERERRDVCEIPIRHDFSRGPELIDDSLHLDRVPDNDGIREKAQAARLVHDLLEVALSEFALVGEEKPSRELVALLAAVELKLDPVPDFVIVDVAENVNRLHDAPERRKRLRQPVSTGNQVVAVVTPVEAAAIRDEVYRYRNSRLRPEGWDAAAVSTFISDDVGVFYVVQLEPEHDPTRFKAGFTTEMDGRLRKHRCSAPFALVLQTWPCKRTWERAAIDSTTVGCEQLHTEVFRAPDLDTVVARLSSSQCW